ncbi:MAG TPA: DUF302 domain-containing protein [Solirubrobacterales bacterium]
MTEMAASSIEGGVYGFGRRLNVPYDQAVERVKAALKTVGFGVLAEIDVRKTMKEKLNADFRPYVILGACNPPIAHRAFSADLDVGLLLPCNVVVYADGEDKSVVRIMDPLVLMSVAKNDEFVPMATEVRGRLEKALQAL